MLTTTQQIILCPLLQAQNPHEYKMLNAQVIYFHNVKPKTLRNKITYGYTKSQTQLSLFAKKQQQKTGKI
ncbi:MAG: hypothetical protein O7D30_11290 [Rickettsia endosymbiont of Ixodes persulcatus]|nr:hypothetical protein [Rickettsia endosymbiont of Ixodes persulcatus]